MLFFDLKFQNQTFKAQLDRQREDCDWLAFVNKIQKKGTFFFVHEYLKL